MIDCYKKAFGNFDIENDPDFVAKFSLDIILRDQRFSELYDVMSDEGEWAGMAGDPGWEILCTRARIGYDNWPPQAAFRVYLDPEEYWTVYPEVYLTEKTFYTYVRQIVEAYLWFKEIEKTPEVEKILALVQEA